jgi:hypothetical protein
MTVKPIIDIHHKGKRVVIDFGGEQRGPGVRYDIFVNGRATLTNAFPEEVMRWLDAMLDAEVASTPAE